jgi:hypothetical protein
VNGQVVRTIGKTTVGSIDLMKSVDSKFEIVRSVEKALKEAVSTSKKAQSGAIAVPEKINFSEAIDEGMSLTKPSSSTASSSLSSSSSSSSSPSASSLSSIRALAKNLIKKI